MAHWPPLRRLIPLAGTIALAALGCHPQQKPEDALAGTWQCTRLEPVPGTAPSALFLALEEGGSGQRHLFREQAYAILDPAGQQVHRWAYKLDDTLLVVASDSARFHWTADDAFQLQLNGGTAYFSKVNDQAP